MGFLGVPICCFNRYHVGFFRPNDGFTSSGQQIHREKDLCELQGWKRVGRSVVQFNISTMLEYIKHCESPSKWLQHFAEAPSKEKQTYRETRGVAIVSSAQCQTLELQHVARWCGESPARSSTNRTGRRRDHENDWGPLVLVYLYGMQCFYIYIYIYSLSNNPFSIYLWWNCMWRRWSSMFHRWRFHSCIFCDGIVCQVKTMETGIYNLVGNARVLDHGCI